MSESIEAHWPAPLLAAVERVPVLRRSMHFVWRFFERWGEDHCSIIAAAMAFFGILSVFPLVLAVVAILGRTITGNKEILTQFREFVASFFPGAAGEIMSEVDAISSATDTTALGAVAIASLLWSGRAYFDTLAAVLNGIWPHTQARFWIQHQIALWSLFIGAGVLWMLSTGATFALSAARALSAELPNLFVNQQPELWNFLAKLVSFILTTLMFWLIYRFLPNVTTRRRRRLVWGAALIGGVGWEISKWVFTSFIGSNVVRYKATYGSVAGIVLTMMWIYLSSLILLLGAEAAAVYEELCGVEAPDDGIDLSLDNDVCPDKTVQIGNE
jgi:membrane protein